MIPRQDEKKGDLKPPRRVDPKSKEGRKIAQQIKEDMERKKARDGFRLWSGQHFFEPLIEQIINGKVEMYLA